MNGSERPVVAGDVKLLPLRVARQADHRASAALEPSQLSIRRVAEHGRVLPELLGRGEQCGRDLLRCRWHLGTGDRAAERERQGARNLERTISTALRGGGCYRLDRSSALLERRRSKSRGILSRSKTRMHSVLTTVDSKLSGASNLEGAAY